MKINIRAIWRIVWRLLLSLLVIVCVVIITIISVKYREDNSEYYFDNRLSETLYAHFYYNLNETRVFNCETNCYILNDLQWIVKAAANDSLTVFCRDGKRGFLNVNTGEIVIPEQYQKAWVFSEGVAAVVMNGKIGFIDSNNQTVLPFEYDYAYRNGMPIDYLFRDGYCTMTNARGACGLINKAGNWVVEPKYDCIWTPHEGKYRIVKDGDKYGLLNENFEFIFPIEYEYIEYSNIKGVLLTKDGYKWRADYDGTVLDAFVYDNSEYLYYPIGDWRYTNEAYYGDEDGSNDHTYNLSNYLTYRVYDKFGIIRRDNGKVIIPALYNQVNMLSPTLFEVYDGMDNKWLLMDVQGNVIDNK